MISLLLRRRPACNCFDGDYDEATQNPTLTCPAHK
jgi:hypothetical protein